MNSAIAIAPARTREHGTRACYVLNHCRCFRCRVANTNYEYTRQQRLAAGTWQPYAAAADTRDALAHIRALH